MLLLILYLWQNAVPATRPLMPAGRAASPQVRNRIKWLLISNVISKYFQQCYTIICSPGKSYHRACFKCRACCLEIQGGYFIIGTSPVCHNCYKVDPVKVQYLHMWHALILSHNVIIVDVDPYFSVQNAWNHWRGNIFHAGTSFSVRRITRYDQIL